MLFLNNDGFCDYYLNVYSMLFAVVIIIIIRLTTSKFKLTAFIAMNSRYYDDEPQKQIYGRTNSDYGLRD